MRTYLSDVHFLQCSTCQYLLSIISSASGPTTVVLCPTCQTEAQVVSQERVSMVGVSVEHEGVTICAGTLLGGIVSIGQGTTIWWNCNLYNCRIGKDCRIGSYTEIQRGVVMGSRCKVSSHTFVCTGVQLGNDVFIGHGVIFTNDKYPVAVRDGVPTTQQDSEILQTSVGDRVSIGSGSVILPVTIGAGAIIGAGTVVTRDVPSGETWVGNPARRIR